MSDRVLKSPQKDYPERDLRDFGTGLHALQDSFSHEGVPDVPGFLLLNCASLYAWGHPAASGGWNVHDTDLTYLPNNRGKAMAMARTTYDQLCRYREVVQAATCAAHWKDLQTTVERFVHASTKTEKWAWFRADEGLSRDFKCEFLEGISIPDGGDWCEVVQYRHSDTATALRSNSDESGIVAVRSQKSPKAIIEATLHTWFVKRDVAALTRLFVDQSAFKAANRLASYSADKVAAASTALFSLWLVQDHGSVHRSLGLKGDALMKLPIVQSAITAGASKEFAPAKGARLVKYNSLSEALYEVGPGKELFDFKVAPCKDGKGECALAAARLKKAPYENLLLEYRKSKDQWLLVKIWSLVDR